MIYLSVDVEASGPVPGLHYLVSLGAAPVVRAQGGLFRVDLERTFYAELSPLEGAAEVPEAMAVHGLSRPHLEAHGLPPAVAMRRFAEYLAGLGPVKTVVWPASFDHPFIAYYCHRFLGENPVGHGGFDIASYTMGLFGETGRNATYRAIRDTGYVTPHNPNEHNALADAIEQGETLAWLLSRASLTSRDDRAR